MAGRRVTRATGQAPITGRIGSKGRAVLSSPSRTAQMNRLATRTINRNAGRTY